MPGFGVGQNGQMKDHYPLSSPFKPATQKLEKKLTLDSRVLLSSPMTNYPISKFKTLCYSYLLGTFALFTQVIKVLNLHHNLAYCSHTVLLVISFLVMINSKFSASSLFRNSFVQQNIYKSYHDSYDTHQIVRNGITKSKVNYENLFLNFIHEQKIRV